MEENVTFPGQSQQDENHRRHGILGARGQTNFAEMSAGLKAQVRRHASGQLRGSSRGGKPASRLSAASELAPIPVGPCGTEKAFLPLTQSSRVRIRVDGACEPLHYAIALSTVRCGLEETDNLTKNVANSQKQFWMHLWHSG